MQSVKKQISTRQLNEKTSGPTSQNEKGHMLNTDNLVYWCLKVIHQGLDYQSPPLALALTSSFICSVCDTLKSKALKLLCCQSLPNVIFLILSLNTMSTYLLDCWVSNAGRNHIELSGADDVYSFKNCFPNCHPAFFYG